MKIGSSLYIPRRRRHAPVTFTNFAQVTLVFVLDVIVIVFVTVTVVEPNNCFSSLQEK